MSTIFKNILPIPESIVVGTGSYTVPANKYGYLCCSARTSISFSNVNSYSGAAANVVSGHQWLAAGSSITVQTTAPSANTSGAQYYADTASASVNINSIAVIACNARVTYYGSANSGSVASVGWSVSLFPIPLNNLPSSLIT